VSISMEAQKQEDEYLIRSKDPLAGATTSSRSSTEIDDIRINWSSSFDTAVYNESLIRLAAKREGDIWYNKQTDIIKKFLENKYHKQFSSYNEAKDHAFLDHERKNRSNYVTPVINSKREDRNRRSLKTRTNVKGLRALKIRETEIKNGIINYSAYPTYEVNGVPLKDIKDINALNNAYSNLLGQFIDNKWREFESDYITKILGASFDNSLLKTKNSIYQSLNKWDRLDFMQFYIYYDQLINRPTPIPMNPQEAKLFEEYLDKINSITSAYVTNYVNANKNNDVSLFHADHWKIIWKRDYGNSLFHINTAKNKHKELKEKELNRLINTTSIHATTTIDKLVSLLRITNLDELQWLNDHPHKGDEFDKRYSNAKLRDVNNPQDPSKGKILPPDYYEQLAISSIRIELANGAIAGGVIRKLELTDIKIKDWLYENLSQAQKITSFLHENSISGTINKEIKGMTNEFLTITKEIPNAKFERYKELLNLIKENPFALIQDCIENNGLAIEHYTYLYEHTLPNECLNRLNELGSAFKDQPLNEGNAAAANVDYYGVEVTKNPDFNKDGIPDSDEEIFLKYRENFATLASGGKKDFQFSCDIPGDSDDKADVSWKFIPYFPWELTKWNSYNPLTTIFKIDANADVFMSSTIADDGAIMISEYTSSYWIGSTIATEFSGTQPFSGNRQWGYIRNQSGNLELFARAVDIARLSNVMTYSSFIGLGGNFECKEDTYYNIGEATWSNLQEQIKNWVVKNGGEASVIPKTAIRFDKNKLKEMLEKNEAIDKIKCN
uniref:hypothetical protein n=1 Tax=uncultured Tenacibaculum sp. TaxID=174713 RepID=UPI00261D0462